MIAHPFKGGSDGQEEKARPGETVETVCRMRRISTVPPGLWLRLHNARSRVGKFQVMLRACRTDFPIADTA